MYKNLRIGSGFDIHRLIEGRRLIIGGIEIPFEKGLSGHSDADVLIHAIIDSILGAMGKADIGTFFPDTDNKFKDIDSKILLKKVVEIMKKEGFSIINIDTNIIAQAPKLMPHIPLMKEKLAQLLEIEVDQISIKAKTMENLDSIGKGEGIAAQASVLIIKK